MRSSWDDVAAKNLDGLDLLVYASRLVGAAYNLRRMANLLPLPA